MAERPEDALAARLLHHRSDSLKPGEAVTPAIQPAAVFHLPGDPAHAPFVYGRYDNPTWRVLEEALGVLEGAPSLIFPSGMAAIAAVLFTNLRSGDKLLLPSDGYFAARALGETFLKPFGVQVDTRPTAQFLQGGFAGYRLVHAETPSNPGLEVCDLKAVAAAAHKAGALFSVDNTTMTAFGQRPFDLGADIVVCSDTKALGGHSDALMGHVAALDAKLFARMMEWRKYSGAIASPFDAFLIYRGLETLEVRLQRMCASAQILAERLSGHAKVASVRYPGLAGDPSHRIAKSQMPGYGSMIALTLARSDAAERFIGGCSFVQPSTSFGGVRTCAERRARWGDAVPEGFVRLSVGLEPVEPLWAAMKASLDGLPG